MNNPMNSSRAPSNAPVEMALWRGRDFRTKCSHITVAQTSQPWAAGSWMDVVRGLHMPSSNWITSMDVQLEPNLDIPMDYPPWRLESDGVDYPPWRPRE